MLFLNYSFSKFHCAKDLIFLLFQCLFLLEVFAYQMSVLKTDASTTKPIRATNLTIQKPQNVKEYFQFTQRNSPVRTCQLTILTYTTLHQEFMLFLFINSKWLEEDRERWRREIFQFWADPGPPFALDHGRCYLLKYKSWLPFYIWWTEFGIKQASSSSIVQALLLLTQYNLYFTPMAQTLWWLAVCQPGWL